MKIVLLKSAFYSKLIVHIQEGKYIYVVVLCIKVAMMY